MSTKLIFFFRLFISICFIVLAGVVFMYPNVTQLTDSQTYGFSALLFIYGIFRVYRAFKSSENAITDSNP
jgi:uncharacterized membrane protein HdeD (DUF308 family)